MASRDIANMHVFLDLKKKFPDLPDETLRHYISLFSEDQEKCLSLLQKESENHYHPSQPFPDFRLPGNKVNAVGNDYKQFVQDTNKDFSSTVNSEYLYLPKNYKNTSSVSGRSSSHAGILRFPRKPLNQNISSKLESLSAPVITNSERPFKDIYKQSPVSSQAACQLPGNRNDQFIFETTKNHFIEAPKTHESAAYLSVSGKPEQSRKHAVKLSITPSFPFHQQHINVLNNSVCTTASHSQRFDRHTTSVNFQLQTQTSNQFPIEISTIPTNLGQACDSKDFCSHVQISVGEQGATFTAVRLQHPNYSQTESSPRLPNTEAYTPSSQFLNSNLPPFSNQRVQLSPNTGRRQFIKPPVSLGFDQNQNIFFQPNVQMTNQNCHSSHDYVLAVKNQQISQLDSILNELEKEKLICMQLKTEVSRLEEEARDVLKQKTAACFPDAEELKKLKDEIKNLRVEVGCLSMEVDSAGENLPSENVKDLSKTKSSAEEDEEEKNQWLCEKCSFANHPALEICEICELPKNSSSFFDDK